jgi:hypothetical protein
MKSSVNLSLFSWARADQCSRPNASFDISKKSKIGVTIAATSFFLLSMSRSSFCKMAMTASSLFFNNSSAEFVSSATTIVLKVNVIHTASIRFLITDPSVSVYLVFINLISLSRLQPNEVMVNIDKMSLIVK